MTARHETAVPHAPGRDAGPGRRVRRPIAVPFSLLATGLAERLLAAGGVLALLWLATVWALT